MSADIAARRDCEFHISAVGEANVTEKMIEVNAVYGGEGNGGPIDPRVGYVRDSFVAMAQVLDAMASRGKSISELVADLPDYQIYKTKVEIASPRIGPLMDAVEQHFKDSRSNWLDGLRLDWNDRWVLIRPSNTEPIVRVIAEAPDLETARQLCQSVVELARDA